jgi:Protein of unknown function (DUF2946)
VRADTLRSSCHCAGWRPSIRDGLFPSLFEGSNGAVRTDRIATMRLHRSTRLLTSWIAVLALLMAALAPSISHALQAKTGASWIEVCTSIGAKWVQPDGGSTDQAPSSGGAHPFEHCPYCSLQANTIAVPAAPVALVPAPSLSHLLPTAFLPAPRTLFSWVSAQPRAPPQFS